MKNPKADLIDLTDETLWSDQPLSSSHSLGPTNPLSRTCSYGHTYFPRSAGQNCPFCFDLLRQYRDFANRNGGTLVSRSLSGALHFRCHRKGHSEFMIPISSLNNHRYSNWCPDCNPTSRGLQRKRLKPSAASTSAKPIDPSYSRAMYEQGKKDQAKLLSSAKLLYNLSKPSLDSPPPSLVRQARLSAHQDSNRFPNVTPQQSLIIHAILLSQSDDARPHAWNLLAECLEVSPEGTSREKLYRMAAKLVHPDKCQHPRADEAFKSLTAINN